MTIRLLRRVIGAALVIVAAVILRDPPWAADMTYGLYPPEVDDDGRAFQWTEGRASFFIPASASSVTIELGGHDIYDVTVTISIDGRPADRLVLAGEWRTVSWKTNTRPTSRSYRRIDLACNRVIGDDFQRGVRVRWHLSGAE